MHVRVNCYVGLRRSGFNAATRVVEHTVPSYLRVLWGLSGGAPGATHETHPPF